jgi:hypothetical protein
MKRFHTYKNTHIYRQNVAPYIFTMFHNNGEVVDPWERFISKSKQSLPNDNESDVGGLKYTPLSNETTNNNVFVFWISCDLCDEP